MSTTEHDYYEVLGVARGASDAEIKRAFRRLARELHPDVSEAPDAEERFRRLAEAYEVLSNQETRRQYDRYGAAGLRRSGYSPSGVDFGGLSDLFAAFFGEGLFGQAQTSRPARGDDLAALAEISLDDAFAGVAIAVPVRVAVGCDRCDGDGAEPGTSPVACPACAGTGRLQQVSQSVFGQFVRSGTCPTCEGLGRVVESPCTTCDGAGRLGVERELSIDVPAGIHDGQRIRLRGAGHAGVLGGPSGDAFVQVRVRPDERLVRDGDDLVTASEITMIEAALGTTMVVETPEGELELEIAAGTQPGDVHVLRGKGMPSLSSGRRGDLRVRVDVSVPRRLDDEGRVLLESLGEKLGEDAYREDDRFIDRLKSAFR